MTSIAGRPRNRVVPSATTCPSANPELSAGRVGGGRVAAVLAVVLFLSMLPVTMIVPVLRELVADRFGASPFWTHSFMSFNMVGAVATAWLGGAWADRVRQRKRILALALLADAAFVLLMREATSLPLLLAARFAEGAAHVLAVSTLMAMASDWADPRRRGRTMGLVGSAMMLGTACGAPLGGRLGQANPLWVLDLGACLAAVAGLLAWFVVQEASDRGRAAGFREALRLLSTRRELVVPYAYALIERFCVGIIVSSFVLYLSECQGLSPSQRGNLLAMFLLPFAVLCYPVGRLSDRFGRAVPMAVGSVAFGVVFAGYGLVPASWLGGVMVVSGVLSALMFAPNIAMCADLAPKDRRATAYAGFNVAGSLGFLAGPLVGGVTHSLESDPVAAYRLAFVIGGAAIAGCALVTLPALLRMRRTGLTR